jgi:hypothetical protein
MAESSHYRKFLFWALLRKTPVILPHHGSDLFADY